MARGSFKSERRVIDVRGLGFPELQKKLNDLTNTVGKQVVSVAMGKAARGVLRPAVKDALSQVSPGDSKPITRANPGKLKTNPIQVYKGKSRGGARRPKTFRWNVASPSREKLGIDPDERGFYPLTLERGGNVGRDGTGSVEPRYMLRRARDSRAGTYKGRLAMLIARGIDEKVKKLGRRKAFR